MPPSCLLRSSCSPSRNLALPSSSYPPPRHPSCHPAPACPLSSSCPAIAVPRLLHLFPLDCACGSGARVGGWLIRGRRVMEGKLVRGGRASASRCRGRRPQGGLWVLAIKEGSRSCPSRRVPSRLVRDLAIKAGAGAGAGSPSSGGLEAGLR